MGALPGRGCRIPPWFRPTSAVCAGPIGQVRRPPVLGLACGRSRRCRDGHWLTVLAAWAGLRDVARLPGAACRARVRRIRLEPLLALCSRMSSVGRPDDRSPADRRGQCDLLPGWSVARVSGDILMDPALLRCRTGSAWGERAFPALRSMREPPSSATGVICPPIAGKTLVAGGGFILRTGRASLRMAAPGREPGGPECDLPTDGPLGSAMSVRLSNGADAGAKDRARASCGRRIVSRGLSAAASWARPAQAAGRYAPHSDLSAAKACDRAGGGPMRLLRIPPSAFAGSDREEADILAGFHESPPTRIAAEWLVPGRSRARAVSGGKASRICPPASGGAAARGGPHRAGRSGGRSGAAPRSPRARRNRALPPRPRR